MVKGDYWEIGMSVHYVTFESYPVCREDVSPEGVRQRGFGFGSCATVCAQELGLPG